LEDLFPQGLAELGNTDKLKDVTIKVLNNNDKPLVNTFTSERMIDSTINLYYELLNKSS